MKLTSASQLWRESMKAKSSINNQPHSKEQGNLESQGIQASTSLVDEGTEKTVEQMASFCNVPDQSALRKECTPQHSKLAGTLRTGWRCLKRPKHSWARGGGGRGRPPRFRQRKGEVSVSKEAMLGLKLRRVKMCYVKCHFGVHACMDGWLIRWTVWGGWLGGKSGWKQGKMWCEKCALVK